MTHNPEQDLDGLRDVLARMMADHMKTHENDVQKRIEHRHLADAIAPAVAELIAAADSACNKRFDYAAHERLRDALDVFK